MIYRYLHTFLVIIALAFVPVYIEAEPSIQDINTQKEQISKKEIEIVGLKHIEPKEAYAILGVKSVPWYAFWKGKTKKIPVSLIPSIESTLKGFLDSKGYYDAQIKIKNDKDKVVVYITENEPVRVADINISSDYNIKEYITFKSGDPFETQKFIDIKKSIKNALLKDGYCSYDLDTKAYVDLDTRNVNLLYRLKKGGLCTFGEAKVIKKPDDIPKEVILSRMKFKEGEVFTTEKINESYASLNQLGVFGETLIDTNKKFFNVVPPEISAIKKEKLHSYTIAGGVDSEVGPRIKATYDHYNFMGGARKIGVLAQYSSDLKKGEVNFFQPVLFSYDNKYFVDLYIKSGYFQEAYDTYDEENAYFNAKLSYSYGFLSIDAGVALENIDIVKTASDDSIIEGSFLMLYPYMEFVYDKRDSKLNPKNGYYFSFYAEYGLPFDEEASNYYKFIIEGRYIKTIERLTLATVGKIGVLDDSAGELPASKFFYAGGPYSNRAYGDKEIGMTNSPTSDESLGGRSWLNFSAEADYPIWGNLYGAMFYDATMISSKSYDFSASWIQSAGVGARYETPMGPLKIDFAMNIHEPTINRISLMIGQSF